MATTSPKTAIAADRVEGTEVYNSAGEHLGEVEDVIIDKASGKVAYAVMSFGGFLGLGERFYPLPWKALSYDPALGGYVVDLDKDRLESGPSYSAGEQPWSDPDYGRSVHGHYGFSNGV